VAIPLVAVRAYAAAQAQAASLAQAAGAVSSSGPAPDPHAFGEILKNSMNDTVQSSRAAEQAMSKQVQGKADLVDTVTAISSAEANLNTVMAVRDQVINAYQDVLKMPI
jgi:flagellar hook-basal body complex protein FliE